MARSIFFQGVRMFPTKSAISLLAAAWLGGCVESTATSPPRAEVQQSQPHRDGAGPRGASVALTSLSGGPQPVADRVKTAFAQEAATREIPLSESKNADYLARGYLDARPTESGTAITLVLDIFDAAKKRALRLEEAVFVKAGAAADDIWSAMDVAAIGDMAAKTASDLSAFLTSAPEAQAGAGAKSRSAPESNEISAAVAGSSGGRTIVPRKPATAPASALAAADVSLAALR